MAGIAEIIGVGGAAALVIGVVVCVRLLSRREKNLDGAYHAALHAESTGDYDVATGLYQGILDRYGSTLNQGIKAHIRERIETIRHQQEYLSQFGKGKPRSSLSSRSNPSTGSKL